VVSTSLLGGARLSLASEGLAGEGSDLDAALERAKAAGKPLLVLANPADAAARADRGDRFGVFLNRATDAQLAPLALCELICADEKRVHERFPAAPTQAPLLLVETDGRAPPFKGLTWSPPPESWRRRGDEDTQKATLEVRRDIDAIAAGVKEALWGAPVQERRLAQLRSVVGPGASEAAATIDEAMKRAALVIQTPQGTTQLARGVEARWRRAPPPGAKWAVSSGCGTDIEGGEPNMMDCGMGFIPEISQRFLMLWVKPAK
jgi:hypothetical protein